MVSEDEAAVAAVGVFLVLAGLLLVGVGLTGSRGLLPRQRGVGLRTKTTMRSDAAGRQPTKWAGGGSPAPAWS